MNNINHETPCVAVDLGPIDYLSAWDLQKSLHRQVVDGLLPYLLLLLEHSHVYTLGRRGTPSDILASPDVLGRLGVEVHYVDRGGEVTYHGPGQLVGYPIVNLREWGGGPLEYVRALERVVIATLAEFGIHAESSAKPTGVWVGDSKIAAIGVKVSRGVTTHGFAINVAPDLSYFDHIVPCGMLASRVTSMAVSVPDAPDLRVVMRALARHFGEVFGWSLEWSTLEQLQEQRPPAEPVPSGL